MKWGIDEEKGLALGSSVRDMFRRSDLLHTTLCFSVILSHSSSGVWLVIGYGVSISSTYRIFTAPCSYPLKHQTITLFYLPCFKAGPSSPRWPASTSPSSPRSSKLCAASSASSAVPSSPRRVSGVRRRGQSLATLATYLGRWTVTDT